VVPFLRKSIFQTVQKRVSQHVARKHVDASFRHISGPLHQTVHEDEVVLVLLGRNVSPNLETFFKHHRSLGVRHVLYVDNGSTDDSLDKAISIGNITVASCSAEFKKYQNYIRNYCAQKYYSGGWRLMLDADELFDYPGSSQLSLSQLVMELNKRRYTAVVAQMLDMVPPGRLLDYPGTTLEEAVRTHIGYHLDGIKCFDYHSDEYKLHWFFAQNGIANSDIKILHGGIRALLFGENCMLTKHPLFKTNSGINPMPHPHVSTGLNCAGFSALISHYKFSGDLIARDVQELAENRRSNIVELEQRICAFEKNPSLTFDVPGLRKKPSLDELLAEKFLVADDEAREYLRI
jgi:glycosyl transferase family 2